jgi:two-component system response regulator AtoC
MLSPDLSCAAASSREPGTALVFGCSEAMQLLRQQVDRVAAADIPVLIEGESGTGKEVLAKLIHQISPRSGRAFVKVSCPAIPATLLESELFGYEKGAFTGAQAIKPGWVEQADGGTLMLDEIAELDISVQAKLLQLLQDGQFFRIGGKDERKVDLRVLCATNRRLEQEVAGGAFRRDLYYRINVVRVHIPPLRERRCDIPLLVDHFLKMYNRQYGRQTDPLPARRLQQLAMYDWPGNIRQLENAVRRYVVLNSEDALDAELAAETPPAEPAFGGQAPASLKGLTQRAVQRLERAVIIQALRANQGNRRKTAQALNISYRALFYKIKEAGLSAKKLSRRVENEEGHAPQSHE